MAFLVFKYPHFYPSGGWGDFAGFFETIEEAEIEARVPADDISFDGWAEIVGPLPSNEIGVIKTYSVYNDKGSKIIKEISNDI